MKNEILAKLFEKMQQSKGFPALKSTVDTVLARLSVPDDSQDLVAPIVSDFALTQQVLQMANSAMYAPFAKNIPSVSKALQVIGYDAVRHIVLRVPSVAAFSTIDSGLAQASLSSNLAKEVVANPVRAEDASIAAMMYNLGALVASRYLPDEMSLIMNLAQDKDLELAAIEVIGMTLPELGAHVAKEWRFPEPLVKAASAKSEPTLARVAQFANQVAKMIYENHQRDIAAVVDSFGVQESLRERLTTTIEDLILNQPLRMTKDELDEVALEELLWSLTSSTPSSANELAERLFYSIKSIFDTSHCIFASRSVNDDLVVEVVNAGSDTNHIKNTFVVHSEFEPTAFGVVVKKAVDLALLNVASLRHGTLPDWYAKMVPDVKSLLIMPISNGDVVGMLIYGWSRRVKFTDREFELLRKLRNLFLRFYPKIAKP